MSTTSAYGWNIPDNTDLVKDGALAIRTLGNAIDTSMNTALGTKKAGMVLLNTTSFSGVSSQAISDVFSATYRNYLVIINYAQNTTSASLGLRLRVSGSDAATNYFWALRGYSSGGAAQDTSGASSTFFYPTHSVKADGAPNAAYIYIHEPFTAARTMFTTQAAVWNAGDFLVGFSGGGMHSTATSYTGLSFTPSVGTITGTVEVYGVNK
jgi:hypothetical protein